MMDKLPRSVTAIVHIRFVSPPEQGKPIGEGETGLLDHLMKQATGLNPEHQEMLVRFARRFKRSED
ncbi:hypothetical protein LCGC14_0699150 [marine sediment metagenome]|uniref:Uncharacterized protein n=1 Tax=marine sediment metagenome TaxID=412755 RepID=A0A0F9QN05_9ZZZZ